MSQRYSDSKLEEKTQALMLEQKFGSNFQINSESESLTDKSDKSSLLGVDNLALANASSMPSLSDMPKVVLSTDSPAALKAGHQQIIPSKLAMTTKTKMRSQGPSPSGKRDSGRREVQSMPPTDLRYEEGRDMGGSGGTLQRNRRNMSYKVATDGFTDITDEKQLLSPPTLQPLTETATVQPARSPARSKRTLGRKKGPRNRSSFKDDPRLYQEVRERGLTSVPESDDDFLDDTGRLGSTEPDEKIVVQNYRPAQMTWSQLPQVLEQGILQKLCAEERKRQEAIFEIIVSEYSYQHSLNVLIDMFKNSKELQMTMTTTEHHHLFSNICDIQEASKRFFDDLEMRHKLNPVIHDISDIVEYHTSSRFDAYVIYCSNEIYQQRTLQKLLNSNVHFKEALQRIQSKPECGGLPIISFLILPMQRVTRLPLLMDTICQKTNRFQVEYDAATRALKAISKLVKMCNEGARKMERTEQMFTIQTQLEFGKIKGFPLISTSRWLLKSGELTVFVEESGIFRKVFGKQSCFLFLFNDVLILTRKKSEESYTVQDYAKLDQVEVEAVESSELPHSPPGKVTGGGTLPRSGSNTCLFKIIMKKNSGGELEQIVLAADSESDRARWVNALQENHDDLVNKEGLPQVEIIKAHLAKQPDELSLQQTDVIIVFQKVDGWYRGERIRDWEKGWFPESCARVITNCIAVQRNVQRMERLRIETDV
ncbi:rho guanine nucleotide exchange factor 16 [Carcharodon carcharias]|uniref:rho guanine nucleotide exchange factor 16 n=1 Tax=Carcharodon carcharias TaxID=13397 RepID=UPI001B7F1459|nr:rho guanine nucleotide exchange factor 16 [Carcharodon carcharias]XP_041062528.1 rho guanine nucleotide exchange factor 16 [Carcharodon carcharias]